MRLYQWIGVGLASVGFLMFYWDQLLISMQDRYSLGNSWIIIGAITWAVFAAIQKYYVQFKDWRPQEVNLVVYVVSAVALFPLLTASELTSQGFWPTFILVLLGLNTIVAYGSFAEALSRIPAGHVSLIVSVNPLITIFVMEMITSYGLSFVAPEPIHWRGYLGACAVVSGVALAVVRRPARQTSKIKNLAS